MQESNRYFLSVFGNCRCGRTGQLNRPQRDSRMQYTEELELGMSHRDALSVCSCIIHRTDTRRVWANTRQHQTHTTSPSPNVASKRKEGRKRS